MLPMLRSFSASLACFSLLGAPSAHASAFEPVSAMVRDDDDSGAAHTQAVKLRQAAEERFFEEKYDEAIHGFEQAHELDADPTDLYNIGRIYEQQGDLPSALEHYERFAALPGLSLEERAAAAERIEVLRVLVAKSTRETSSSGSNQNTASPMMNFDPSGARRDTEPGRPMIVSGAILLGAGLIGGLAGGVAFGLGARRRADQLGDLAHGSNPARLTLAEAEALHATGKDYSTLQITFIVTGSAIALTGAALLTAGLLKNRKSRSLAVFPMFDSRMVSFTGAWRF